MDELHARALAALEQKAGELRLVLLLAEGAEDPEWIGKVRTRLGSVERSRVALEKAGAGPKVKRRDVRVR